MSAQQPEKNLHRALNETRPHDHLCLIYETEREQFDATVEFIKIGLARNERCIYIVDESPIGRVLNAMRAQGIAVEQAMDSGALIITNQQDTYLQQGIFDPDRMINTLKDAIIDAKRDGFSALRATGEMTWILGGHPGVDRLTEYEAKLNLVIPYHDMLGICQYNRQQLSPEVIRDVIRTHPKVIYAGLVCNNHYYIPPDELLGDHRISHEVERLLSNIVLREENELALHRSLREREEAEKLLAAEKERLAVTLHSIGDGVISIDIAGRVMLLNQVATALTGWSHDAIGKPAEDVFQLCDTRSGEVLQPPRPDHGTARLTDRRGNRHVIVYHRAPIRDRQGDLIGYVLAFRDITMQQKLEEEVLKARKLESIGLLAGGIAHDFNNILTAILGNITLAHMYSQSNDKAQYLLTQAEIAIGRASNLTQQLLTFSKGGSPVKSLGSIPDVLREVVGFVLSGSAVGCEWDIAPDLWYVHFDSGQISQVFNNLVINAVQAMPNGGKLVVSAENCTLRDREVGVLPAGCYVKIAFRDHGAGIEETHLARIFDPYFTTKAQGNGLGLATSYSIVKHHDGHIAVQSRVGVGTTFGIYLPADAGVAKRDAVKTRHTLRTNGGRILVMDDEPAIRDIARALLKHLGFRVDVAKDGAEAVSIYESARQSDEPIAMLILDLTVPGGVGGRECLAILLQRDANVKAIVSSGYSNDPVMAKFQEYGFAGVATKPYRLEQLSYAIEQAQGQRDLRI